MSGADKDPAEGVPAEGVPAEGGRRRRRAPKGQGGLLRQDILDSASAILAERGDAAAVSIRAVAQGAGVSTAAIYLHFPDRDSLLGEVCGTVFGELEHALAEAAAGAPDPLTALRRQGVAYVRFALDKPEQYRFMLMGRPEESHRPAPSELVASGAFADLVAAVSECQRQGLLPPGDPTPAALALWATVHGLASLLISVPYMPWPDIEQIAGMMTEVAISGLQMNRGAAPDTDRAP